MPTSLAQSIPSANPDTKLLGRYLVFGAILAAMALIYALFNLPMRYLYLVAATPIALVIILNPRLALYQFVFVLFIEYPLVPSVPLYLIDVSMGLVVLAGTLDFLLRGVMPRCLPRLSFNYGYIIVALIVCGLVGHWPELVTRRVLTTGSLLAVFLATFQLSSKATVLGLVKLFFVLAACHSALVLIPFLTTSGEFRSFGFSGVLFDDQAMVALPLGIALYLGAPKRTVIWYLIGIIMIAGGLTATQSRAPIALALVASLFVIWVALRKKAGPLSDRAGRRPVKERSIYLALGGITAVGLIIMLQPQILSTVGERFGELLSLEPKGTTVYRLALWKQAVATFIDYPFFGAGPGGFYHLTEIYPTWHLTPHYPYLKTLGAHNVLLHYLADTGLVGGLGLLALLANQFRLSRRCWQLSGPQGDNVQLALYGWAFLFGISTLVEANWMWGQLSFLAVFFAALVSRQYRQTVQTTGS